jgi:hypothetical protein
LKPFLKSKDVLNLSINLSYEVEMIDELDRRLIQELQKRGRQGYVDLVHYRPEFGKDKLDAIDADLRDVTARLSRLYDALETGKLELDDLAPRIRELKNRQDELSKAKVQVEAELVVQGVEQVDLAMVKAYAQDLRSLLKEADFAERKVFLRSFIKRIEVNQKQVTIHYNLPMPQDERGKERAEVLPIDTLGGHKGTRTFEPPSHCTIRHFVYCVLTGYNSSRRE